MRSTWTVATLGVLLAGGAARAEGPRAPESPCVRLAPVDEGRLDPRFHEALAALRAELAHLDGGPCEPLELTVAGVGHSVVVGARTRDGRSTARAVDDPAALVAVALGLVAGIPAETPAKPAPEGEGERTEAPRAPRSEAPAARDTATKAASSEAPDAEPAPPSGLLSVALEGGARTTYPTRATMADLALRPSVSAGGWVVALALRWAPFGAAPGVPFDEDSYEEVSLGVGVGRRLVFGRSRLDLTLVPSFVRVDMETDALVGGEIGGARSQVRLGGAGTFSYPMSKSWQLTASIDTELSPRALFRDVYIAKDLPPLPAWDIGLRLGAAVDLL